ncbi:TonB-dependent receptor [Arenibacter sp. 6A1]|uniref:TonB-dependent receptor n=1 Tax=Arenibacter sp. 6A1 TaxID=2720391 RepID=UPI00144606F4|nr:TonB-dependent receptor [Arenibacter sp. 6A1]NKI26467.1 TonB-dependent receptor [Arenibacter sp. 6A1]
MKKIYFFLTVFLCTLSAFSQVTITGKVLDGSLGGPLPGANILISGTTIGVAADFDGNFSIEAPGTSGTLVVSYIGFISKRVKFSKAGNIGTISLMEDASQLEGVVVVGSGIIDLAEDRQTPIAVSTIKANEIREKTGNWDLPEVLKSTPSVQNIKGGGFGDGQMFLRGFDQTNTAFLLNGQPINGMEDGKMYWSNWSGVLDIANAVQVQRGLGSSKLAISSVGGTVNIVTKTVDKREGGFFQTMLGNDNYVKTTGYYSTGLMENGLAVSAMLGHWQGDGYVDNTGGQGQTYFLSFGYVPNENNIFNFILTGAPQWHAAAGTDNLRTFLDNGRKYNSWNFHDVDSPNTLNGGAYPGGRNIYHKPVANLSWDLKFNETASLSTVLYGSLGRGSFASVSTDRGTGEPLYARGSNNNHNWYGLVSNFNKQLSENLNFNFGADVRLYKGIHFRDVREFLGASAVSASSNYNGGAYQLTKTYGGINPWNVTFNPNTDHAQRFGYDYEESINYGGVFGQLEYSKNSFSAFFQGSASTQSHVRTEYLNAANQGQSEESDKVNNPGFNLKGGAAYNLSDQNIVFVNAGYYSRQPYHSDLYIDDRNSNQLNPLAKENQKITGLEGGYKFLGDVISANLNVYYTIWDNRIVYSSDDTNGDNIVDEFTQTSPLKQVHSGVELEVFARPADGLNFQGFVSVGNWEYDGNVTTTTSDENGNILSTGDASYIDGVKIGQAAQFTAGISGDYEIFPRFKVDANWNLYDNLYGSTDFGDSEFSTANNRGAIKLPSYNTVDSGVSYRMIVGKNEDKSIQFRVNVNNLFDESYLESSRDNRHVNPGDDVWNGVNTDNRVRFGYGRTWNVSLRYNF